MELPRLVTECLYQGAYVVGSYAERLYLQSQGIFQASLTKDIDIIIPPAWFNKFLEDANKYEFRGLKRLGGIGLRDEGIDYDIWSMELGHYYHTLPAKYSGYAMNIRKQFIKRL